MTTPFVQTLSPAAQGLYDLYGRAKRQDNCLDYIDELCDQICLFGNETNKLTREHILERLEGIVSSIKKTF